jgi:hypothetical protein
MKEGTQIVDHLNVFNTMICQLSSMEEKYEDEDKEITLLCSFPKSWDHLFTSLWFRTTYAINYDTIMGVMLYDETRRRSCKEPSTKEAMVFRG